jgi:hypothetical protein
LIKPLQHQPAFKNKLSQKEIPLLKKKYPDVNIYFKGSNEEQGNL